MNEIFRVFNKMRLKYQLRYARQYATSNNNDVLNEMSFVLINVFGLTSRQVIEIERNGGLTNDDIFRGEYLNE